MSLVAGGAKHIILGHTTAFPVNMKNMADNVFITELDKLMQQQQQ